MEVNLKRLLIEQVAKDKDVDKNLVRSIVNHQFVSIKLMVSLNETGEIHLPYFGRIESNEGRVKYVTKRMEKEAREKNESRNRAVDPSGSEDV